MRKVERVLAIDQSMPILRAALPDLPWRQTMILRLARALDQSMTGFFRNVLAHHGLNEGSLHTLMLVYCLDNDETTPGLLCALVAQTPANMTRILQTLEERGFVSRTAGQFDARQSHIRITDKGRDILLQTLPQTIPPVEQALSGLTEEEQMQFQWLLRKAITSLDQASDSARIPAPVMPPHVESVYE